SRSNPLSRTSPPDTRTARAIDAPISPSPMIATEEKGVRMRPALSMTAPLGKASSSAGGPVVLPERADQRRGEHRDVVAPHRDERPLPGPHRRGDGAEHVAVPVLAVGAVDAGEEQAAGSRI